MNLFLYLIALGSRITIDGITRMVYLLEHPEDTIDYTDYR